MIVSVGDRAGSSIHIPDVIRDACRSSDGPESPGELTLLERSA
jgi:hypothetical protein